jgi:hypothetical protein
MRHSKAPPVDITLWRKNADLVGRFWERLVDAQGFQRLGLAVYDQVACLPKP